jgi:hypothetical protein
MPRAVRLVLILVLILVLLAAIFHRSLLAAAGAFLITQDAPAKCDAAVVLRGEEGDGLRVQEAARLYRAGWVRKIVLSGARRPFGLHETDLSLPWALDIGLPREDLVPIIHEAQDSWAEAQALAPELEKAGFRCVAVISSETDARKLRITYRKAAPRLRALIRTVPSLRFAADSWWRSREGRKEFFLGYVSLVSAWLR